MSIVVEKNNKYYIGILKRHLFWDMKKNVNETLFMRMRE